MFYCQVLIYRIMALETAITATTLRTILTLVPRVAPVVSLKRIVTPSVGRSRMMATIVGSRAVVSLILTLATMIPYRTFLPWRVLALLQGLQFRRPLLRRLLRRMARARLRSWARARIQGIGGRSGCCGLYDPFSLFGLLSLPGISSGPLPQHLPHILPRVLLLPLLLR